MSHHLSAGAVALAGVDSIEATASKLGATARAVSTWRSGAKRPSANSRRRIREAYGIAEGDWDRLPTACGDAAAPEPHVAAEPAGAHPGARERLRRQLARLDALRASGSLTPTASFELERVEVACVRELSRLDGSTLTQRQILRSKAWRELEDRLAGAFEPPSGADDAARAIYADVMRRVSRVLAGEEPISPKPSPPPATRAPMAIIDNGSDDD